MSFGMLKNNNIKSKLYFDNKNSVFFIFIFIALFIHLFLIFSISFDYIEKKRQTKNNLSNSINITLVTKTTEDIFDPDTNVFAQENNIGGGEKKDDKANRTLLNEDNNVEKTELDKEISIPQEIKKELERRVITTTGKSTHSVYVKTLKDIEDNNNNDNIYTDFNLYQKKLKSILGIEDLIYHNKSLSERVLRLTSVTARKKEGVLYQENWRMKVEKIGNQFYPKDAQKLNTRLRMLVIINNDGSLRETQILSSSGYDFLDNYALKVVEMAAPYDQFDDEIKHYDRIELIRTWKFESSKLTNID